MTLQLCSRTAVEHRSLIYLVIDAVMHRRTVFPQWQEGIAVFKAPDQDLLYGIHAEAVESCRNTTDTLCRTTPLVTFRYTVSAALAQPATLLSRFQSKYWKPASSTAAVRVVMMQGLKFQTVLELPPENRICQVFTPVCSSIIFCIPYRSSKNASRLEFMLLYLWVLARTPTLWPRP